MNLEQARFNMIEQQIRPWEVLDPVVLDLLGRVPREDFVPSQYAGLAFADLEIPIGHGQSMLSPKLEARILQSLELRKTDSVLEIGTGSGYMTALLARLAKHVTSVDIDADFTAAALHKLQQHGIFNVTLESGNAACGWSADTAYDVIVLTGSVPVLPDALQRSLSIGGRLFAVVGEAPVMSAMLIRRISEDTWRADKLFETCIPTLQNAPQPERFTF
jgi:protein-L-isoaspartate(D-aspartate) O-methyltransferase